MSGFNEWDAVAKRSDPRYRGVVVRAVGNLRPRHKQLYLVEWRYGPTRGRRETLVGEEIQREGEGPDSPWSHDATTERIDAAAKSQLDGLQGVAEDDVDELGGED